MCVVDHPLEFLARVVLAGCQSEDLVAVVGDDGHLAMCQIWNPDAAFRPPRDPSAVSQGAIGYPPSNDEAQKYPRENPRQRTDLKARDS